MARGNRGEFNTINAKGINCNNVTSTGTATLNDVSISSTFYKSIHINLADLAWNLQLTSTDSPDYVKVLASTYNSTVGIWSWGFDGSALEALNFSFQLPTDWAEGTAITPYLTWGTTSSTGSTQAVGWGLEYYWVNLDSTSTSALAGPTIATQVYSTCPGTVLGFHTTNFAAITDATKEVDSIFNGVIYRNSTSTGAGAAGSSNGDDWSKDAFLWGLSFRYFPDALGSTSTISDK